MGEYDRKQRNELSRVISNNGSGGRQLKGFMDNRTLMNGQKIIQCRNLYRGGNNVNATYIPRFPTDMNGPKKGLSTFVNKDSIPATFPIVQVLDENNLPGMSTVQSGNHVSIVPNPNLNNRNLSIWAICNDAATATAQGYTAVVANARTREEANH